MVRDVNSWTKGFGSAPMEKIEKRIKFNNGK